MQYSALVAAFAAVAAVKAQDDMSVHNSTVTDVTSTATDMASSDAMAASDSADDMMTTAPVSANDTVVSTASVDDRNASARVDSVTYNTFVSNFTATSAPSTREAPYAMNNTVNWNATTTATETRDQRSTSADHRSARSASTHYVSGAGNTLNAGLFGAAFAAAAALLF